MKLPEIVLLQTNPILGDIQGNLSRIAMTVRAQPGDIFVLPELCVCGYPVEDLILRPAFLDAIESAVQDFSKTITGRAVLLPTPWRHAGNTYNAVHLIMNGHIVETRFKHHLPNDGVFDEKRIFTPAPLPAPIPFNGHALGVLICEDLWMPDVAAHLRDAGAEILIAVNASPFDHGKYERRVATARNRARETGLPLYYVNQCGGHDDLIFDGASFIMDRDGSITAQAPAFIESHLSSKDKTITPYPAIAERTYRAATLGLGDYVRKNNFPGVLIGLSGGIDSAISTAMAVDALGADRVRCVMMPSPYTSQDSLEDAAACADMLGVQLDTCPIHDSVAAFEKTLSPLMPANPPDITAQNLQSRARGMILMALSNATGFMVLSTGNKSEIATGYATLYGDMCGGYNALKDIYKTDVYALSHWRNAQSPVMPDRILTKAPTAELKPGQTDQDTLPPYPVLDAILRGLIEMNLSIDTIVGQGHPVETVQRVAQMLRQSEYKRRQSAPGPKTTPRAFGRDRRTPITNYFKG